MHSATDIAVAIAKIRSGNLAEDALSVIDSMANELIGYRMAAELNSPIMEPRLATSVKRKGVRRIFCENCACEIEYVLGHVQDRMISCPSDLCKPRFRKIFV